MNAKVEAEPASRFDTLKLAAAVLLLVGGIVAFYWFEEHSQLVRVLGMLGVVVLAVFIALQTELGRLGKGFVRDANIEVRKVVWPTRTETMQTTLVVVGVVILMGIVLWLLDMSLRWGVGIVTGQGN